MTKTIELNIPKTAAEREELRKQLTCCGCGAISLDGFKPCDCVTMVGSQNGMHVLFREHPTPIDVTALRESLLLAELSALKEERDEALKLKAEALEGMSKFYQRRTAMQVEIAVLKAANAELVKAAERTAETCCEAVRSLMVKHAMRLQETSLDEVIDAIRAAVRNEGQKT